MPPIRMVLVAACFTAGCTMGGDVFPPIGEPPRDAGVDAGIDAGIELDAGLDAGADGGVDAARPIVCVPGTPENSVSVPSPTEPVTVDGAFTGTEWDGVEPLEGLYADVYLDVRSGQLVILNDWRANTEGIDGDCFNRFEINLGDWPVSILLYGDGRIEARGLSQAAVTGVSGFGPSPRSPFDHTIYELAISLAATPNSIDVCLFDPLSLAGCEGLAEEPMVFSLVTGPDSGRMAQRSTLSTGLTRAMEGELCATGAGVCEPGLRCPAPDPERRCTAD